MNQRRYARNPEAYKAKNQRWRDKTGYEWSKVHPERKRASDRARYQRDPEKAKAKNRKFHEARPDVRRLLNAKRRAIKAGAAGRYNLSAVLALFERQRGKCHCGVPIKGCYHIDHKTPLSRGGSNWPRNLQLLCAKCNNGKGTKTMREWLRSLE